MADPLVGFVLATVGQPPAHCSSRTLDHASLHALDASLLLMASIWYLLINIRSQKTVFFGPKKPSPTTPLQGLKS